MTRWQKFKNFIRRPGKWIWAFYGALLFFALASVLLAVFVNGANPLSYALYAAMLALLIYCICVSVRPAREHVRAFVARHELTSRLAADYGFRTFAFSLAGLAVCAVYGLYLAVAGLVLHSAWHGFFAGYYMVLTCLRGAVIYGKLRTDKRYGGRPGCEGIAKRARIKLYLGCGAMFIVLAVAFTALAGILIFSGRPSMFGVYGAITMAAYTFYKIIVSAINALKTKKLRDFTLQALRNISFADALVSVFALQIAMEATFGGTEDQSMHTLNIVMGIAVFAFTLGLGIYMMVRSAAELRRSRNDRPAAGGEEY